MSLLGSRASDIIVSTSDLCLILGYMCSPGRVGLIEAQIPKKRALCLKENFPENRIFQSPKERQPEAI